MTERKFTLQLIQGGAAPSPAVGVNSSTNTGYAAVRNLLRRVLKAKLTPQLTVEDACHLRPYYEDDEMPRMEQLLSDIQELRNAGLDTRRYLNDLPDCIVMADPKVFVSRFPELAAAVPVMLAHDGVQPYTDGLPCRATRLNTV